MNSRRQLLLAAAAMVAPSWAQGGRKTIALLMTGRSQDDDASTREFVAAMERRGWVDGRNAAYQRFFTEGSRERADEAARAAVQANPDLIYTPTGGGVLAARKATGTIPIVFIMVSDPVAAGYVNSLRRPGRNATGVFQMGADAISKRLELIHEALPRSRHVGVLLDVRAADYDYQKRSHDEAPKPKGMSVVAADIARFEQVAEALDRLGKDGASVVVLAPSFTLTSNQSRLLALAQQRGIAIVAYRKDWAEAGALLTYGADMREVHQRSAGIADRILRGAKAAETPVERASKFELIVNQRTAKALGLTLPKNFLVRADRVIE